MGGHAEPPTSPSDDLHRGGVRNQVLQVAPALVEKARLKVLFLVVFVKDPFHRQPESLLPFEDRLLGHHVWYHVALEAAGKKMVRQVRDIVQGVVVGHDGVVIVGEHPGIHLDLAVDLAVRIKHGLQDTAPGRTIPGTILATDRVPLEEHRLFETELDAFDVDGVAADRDAIPAATHGAVGRAQGLFEAHGLALLRRRRDSRLLEDGADARSRRHGVVQHLVVGCVTMLARKVEVLPLPRVHEGLDPLVPDQIHRVVSHLFASDEDHGRCQDLARRGAQRPHRRAQARKARRGKDHA
mmetsp:Transcript_7124/g.17820  ORF Transcript_7124/g.17820 Transcript_7124/m.17820 type:complete len:297 (-) Transcript_7124:88-978(-)